MIELSQIADALDFRQDCLNRNLTPKTAKGYNSMAADYLQFAKPDIFSKETEYQEFKPSLIAYHNHLKNEKELRYKTIKTRFTALNNYFEYLFDEDIISLNPVPQFRARYVREYKASETARTQELELTDIELLINTANNRLWRFVIAVYSLCGLRREELTELDINCVDFENRIFNVKAHPKRTNTRVPFTEQVLDLMLDYLELRISKGDPLYPDSPLFLNETFTNRLRPNRVLINLQRIAERCGLHKPDSPRSEDKTTVKALRHFFTYWFSETEINPQYIDELRGDKRAESRADYIEIRTKRLIEEYRKYAPVLNIKIRKTNKLLF